MTLFKNVKTFANKNKYMLQNLLTTKKLIIAIIIILLIGVAIWFFLFRGSEEQKTEGFLSQFFPGGGDRNAERIIPPASETEFPGGDLVQSSTRQLAPAGISGAFLAGDKIRYIERATGHVFEMDLDGSNETRISNTTIPGIFEVIWSSKGDRAILKYISSGNLNILSAKFTASSTQGVFLPSDINDIVFSPIGERILYTTEKDGISLIVTATPENKLQKILLRSPFRSWKLFWPKENQIYLSTLPTAFQDGFFYRLNTSKGSLEKTLGPRLGLQVTTNGDGVVFSESDINQRTLTTSSLIVKSGEANTLSVKLLPEKCAWSQKEKNTAFCGASLSLPRGAYPDDWHKGVISTNDVLVKINIETPKISQFELPPGLDMVSPFISEAEDVLFFINRRDASLWSVNLTP
jgi:hypothetical protein